VRWGDFTAAAMQEDLEWLAERLTEKYITKVRGIIGPNADDQKSITITGRDEGISYVANPRHVDVLLQSLGLTEAKGCSTPGTRITVPDEAPLSPELAREFRALAARANYLAADRPEIAFATKELCRLMANPTQGAWSGMHCVKSWSSTQSVIALSSGESEYYGVIKGAAVGLGFVSLAQDFGIQLKLRVFLDSSAAKGMCSRLGLGKTTRINTR